MEQTKPIILTDNLSLGYDHKILVSGVTLSILPGEFIGIFGSNGAGKSTFLRTVLGLIRPLAGKINVNGFTPKRGNKHIGYMPQTRHYNNVVHLSSRSIIEASYQGAKLGLPLQSKLQRAQVNDILHLVGAHYYADRSFQQLSGGEKQRILLAQALLEKPSILLLDEPLSNLDPRYQDTFIKLLYDVQQQLNVTILFTSHDPNPLLPVMDRVLYFAQGQAMIGRVDEVITSAKLTALYGTPIEVIRHKKRLLVLGEERIDSCQEHSHD